MMFSGTRNMLVSGGTFNSRQTIVNTHIGGTDLTPFQRLEQVVAPNAFHNSDEYDQPRCHPGTRTAVIERIMAWIQIPQESMEPPKPVMWLNGKAGAGKSAISRSIAEECKAVGLLLATFFFSHSDPTRNNDCPLIPTLAYQMSCLFPEIHTHLEQIISRDPLIFKCSIETQMQSLIIGPILELATFKTSTLQERLIIIDGLDECDNPKAQENILSAIAHILHQHSLPCVFLIASRPEPHIINAFNSYKFRDIQIGLELNNSFNPHDDIRLFLQESFNEIKDTHRLRSTIPTPWPTSDNLKTLVRKASGQFIYASVVVKFVKSPRHQPASRLEIILGLCPTSHENPFAELDALYIQILQSLKDKDTASMFLKALCLRASSSFFRCNHINFISNFLGLDSQLVEICNSDLSSLLYVGPSEDESYSVYMAHASLSDFLFDPSRSGRFHIDKGLDHAMMAIQCLKHAQNSEEYSEVFDAILSYSYCNLKHHCHQASITEDLKDQICKFSYASIPEKWHFLLPLGLLAFIDWMKDEVWEGSQEASDRLLRQLCPVVHIDIQAYYAHPRTTLLIAIAIGTSWENINHFVLARLLEQKFHEDVDGDDLYLFQKISDPCEVLEECTLDILKKTMDHQKYSVAALMLLEYLCNAPEHSCIRSLHGQLRLHIRRTQPWKWQKMCKTRGLLKREQKICQHWYQHWNKVRIAFWEELPHFKAMEKICDIEAYHLALKLVVSCLNQARESAGDYDPQLVDFMRQHIFSFTAMKFPEEKKEAEAAIARFLAEVDREEHKKRQG